MALNVVAEDDWDKKELKRESHWELDFQGCGRWVSAHKSKGAASDRNKTGWMKSPRKQMERSFLRMEWTGVKNSVEGSWKMQTENLPDFTTFRSLMIKKISLEWWRQSLIGVAQESLKREIEHHWYRLFLGVFLKSVI